jgi:hypothetical protein
LIQRLLICVVGGPYGLKMDISKVNGANYNIWADQIISLLSSKVFWMFLEKPLRPYINDNYDLICPKRMRLSG